MTVDRTMTHWLKIYVRAPFVVVEVAPVTSRIYLHFFSFFLPKSTLYVHTKCSKDSSHHYQGKHFFVSSLQWSRAAATLKVCFFFLPKLPLHSVGSILYLTCTALYIHTKTIFIDMTCLHSVASWIDARIPHPGQISTLTNKKNFWHSAKRIFLFLFVN